MNQLRLALLNGKKHLEAQGSDRWPKLEYKDHIFKLSKPGSRNPGYVYVYNTDYKYLGKIGTDGTYHSNEPLGIDIAPLLANPEAAIAKEGKETVSCCCCGRTLTSPLSKKLGIGPICRGGWWFPSSPYKTVEDLREADIIDTAPAVPAVPNTDWRSNTNALTEESLSSITCTKTLELAEVIAGYQNLSSEQKLEFFAYIVTAGED